MSYYFSTTTSGNFEEVIENVIELLKKEGFGVLTEIDIQQTLKKKLNVDFNKYRILGACNPPFAYEALKAENKIGTMLPCNVIVQEIETDRIEIAAVNPMVSMQAIKNPKLVRVATEVSQKLKTVINSLKNEK
jgi:uncharacterized protein (DUF302 family)